MGTSYTDISTFGAIHQTLTTTFCSGATRSLAWRRKQLKELYRMLEENEDALCEALRLDLRKNRQESITSEIGVSRSEAANAYKNLQSWASKKNVSSNFAFKLDSCQIHRHPKGVVLIIGPWNYPVNLLVIPLIGAIAAGNCVLLKPSEISFHTSSLLSRLIEKYLDTSAIRVINGGPEETSELLRFKFDHIFYTGNGRVGRVVMRAAAEYLTPVTLELGGKCPTYVAKDVDVAIAARRIAWGKFLNAGQTCIAPDYVICEKEIQEAFVSALQDAFHEFFGGNDWKQSVSYGRIINEHHWDRLVRMLKGSKGRAVIGNEMDREDLFMAPTVVVDVQKDDRLMSEEIFGPLLPVVTVEGIQGAISIMNSFDPPLAIYVFSKNQHTVEHIQKQTRAGALVSNDCLLHFTINALPFGGVGASGMGRYHGKHSFNEFSDHQASLSRGFSHLIEMANSARYPPYTNGKLRYLAMLLFEKLNLTKKSSD
ncbi:uncharacterized protein VTP21DRAFT_10633 [Calcarisporiella thermophila]|uniref:uncharacterized protein n=1 Tax=Calcarisporiella thermophila TaxID=911321 RepID=UPI003742EBFD